MRTWGLGSANVLLFAAGIVAGLACGGRAAIDDRACVSSDECEDGGRCQAGSCLPSSFAAPGAGASSGPGGAPASSSGECTRSSGCYTPPDVGVAGSAAVGAGGAGRGGSGSGGSSGGFGMGGAGVAPSGGAGGIGGSGSAGSASNGGSGGSAIPDFDRPVLPSAFVGATAIANDPGRDRVYVAVGASAPDFANGILTFEPSTGSVVGATWVAGNPTSLAISADGTTLWVGLHDTSSVLEVDVSGLEPVVGSEYPLPPTEFPPYPHAAGPMVVLPGTTSSLAVSLHYDALSPSFAGVVLLDDGVPRPLRLPSHTGASRLALGPDGYLLGYNNLHTGFGMYSIAVSADGLTQTEHTNLIGGFATDIVYEDTRLFGTDGAVVGVTNPEFPLLLGHLPATGAVFPDTAAGVVWVLREPQSTEHLALVLVDLRTLGLIDATEYLNQVMSPRNLVRSTGGVFVFIADTFGADGFTLESSVFWTRP